MLVLGIAQPGRQLELVRQLPVGISENAPRLRADAPEIFIGAERLRKIGRGITVRIENRTRQKRYARRADQPDIGVLAQQGAVRIDDPVIGVIGTDEPVRRARFALDVQILRKALCLLYTSRCV